MEVSKTDLEKKIENYRMAGEKHRNDANACFGAAEALDILMRELEMIERSKVTQEITEDE